MLAFTAQAPRMEGNELGPGDGSDLKIKAANITTYFRMTSLKNVEILLKHFRTLVYSSLAIHVYLDRAKEF